MKFRKDRILVWHYIRRTKSFSCSKVGDKLGLHPHTVRKFAKELLASGLLSCVKAVNGSYDHDIYTLTEGSDRIRALPQFFNGNKLDQVWSAVRVLKTFTSDDITSITAVPTAFVNKCLKRWTHFGLLSVQPKRSGVRGSFNRYLLIKDLGVGTPIAVEDCLLDSNSGKFLEAKDE